MGILANVVTVKEVEVMGKFDQQMIDYLDLTEFIASRLPPGVNAVWAPRMK
jgi:hypothetical protein